MSVRRDIFGEDLILPGLRGTWITYLITRVPVPGLLEEEVIPGTSTRY